MKTEVKFPIYHILKKFNYIHENEEYKLWKYNSRYLYDTLLIGAIEWPSLTISFLPSTEEDSSLKTYRILLGTHTSQTEQNYLLICKIKIPSSKSKEIDNETIENFYSSESINKYQKLENKIEPYQQKTLTEIPKITNQNIL